MGRVLPDGYEEAQKPRICWVPPHVSSAGEEALELARLAKLFLDPWQEFALVNLLNERADGKWAAFEAAIVVPRQNGKGSILEARELAGLFLFDDEQFIVHSAHRLDTSLEAFQRLLILIERCPDLDRRVQRVSHTNGDESIELKRDRRTGRRARIHFRTRSKGGGKGFTGDLLVLDEAQNIPEASHGALLPTLAARSVFGNPQVLYTGTAVDQDVDPDGVVLARVRERGVRGGDDSLMYMEWSPDLEARLRELGREVRDGRVGPEDVDREFAADPAVQMRANPAAGRRISFEHMERERRSMDPRKYARERLNVGDWPRTEQGPEPVISEAMWGAMRDPTSEALNPVAFAFEVFADGARERAAIGVAGWNREELMHVEVVAHRYGSAWLVDRLVELVRKHNPLCVVCQDGTPAAAHVPELTAAGVTVVLVGSKAAAQACGMLVNAVTKDRLRHLGTRELVTALAGAQKQKVGAAWIWKRDGEADVAPLFAVSLAAWGRATQEEQKKLAGRVEDYRIVQLVD